MQPQLILLCCVVLVGFSNFCNCQQKPIQRGGHSKSSDGDLGHAEDLVPAASRNSAKRSGGNKKNSKDSDSYHVVYESKPQSYSTSYHHSDKIREPTRTRAYQTNTGGNGGGGGKNSYSNPYSSGSSNSNRRSSKENDDDFVDDYSDSPQQKKPRTPRYESDYDYDSSDDNRKGKGFDHKEEYDKSTKNDYHKTGELKDDFSHFGQDSNDESRNAGGRGSRGGQGRNNYSSEDRDRSDSDYDESDSFSRDDDREDNPLDVYEKRSKQALREYGEDDGKSFLNAKNDYKK